MAPPRPRGGGGGDDATPPSRRFRGGGGGDGPHSIAAAQEATAQAVHKGRPPDAGRQRNPQPGDAGRAESGSTRSDAESFVDNISNDPRSVVGRSAEDIAQQFRDAGYEATVEQSTRRGTSGNAVQVRIEGHPGITNIQVHPGGGRHTPEGSPYWKISTSTSGKTWVIPGDFRGADDLRGNVVRYDE